MQADTANLSESATVKTVKRRSWWRCILKLAGVLILLLVLLVLFWLRGALYNHFARYPKEEAAWRAIRAEQQPVTDTAGWNEYRGILHSHSHFSHDSEVSFEQILEALKAAKLDFICLSDHCVDGHADFSWQWRGFHDGKLFIPGFEMKDGIMPFGVAANVVLSNRTDSAVLARQIVENRGVLFYAHPEEKRDWGLPELTGMEIYNLHTDFKRLHGGIGALLPEVLVNLKRYPDHIYHRMFHRPVEFLAHWDELNQTRHITGIAANDCHQNVGFRAYYTTSGMIRIEDTSPQMLKEIKLNGFTRIIARILFGPLEPGRRLIYVQLDPYERSARFVNTHVLAHELNEQTVLDGLRAGRVFIGFDMIANSSGFRWFARDGSTTTVMGESTAFSSETHLHALAPLPCRFTILKDGTQVKQAEGRVLDWIPPRPGKYRVEAELKILGEWTPWVYANPIQLK